MGYPTLPGWFMAGAYLVGALFCVRAGTITRHLPQHSELNPWWGLTFLLLFLGINKLVALQTLLFKLGRVAGRSQGWYEYRRAAQLIFVVYFAATLAALLAVCLKKC